MKMTRLEWAYLQKIALDHPFYDVHKPPLTEREAQAIVEANNRRTGTEFIDSVYRELGTERPNPERKRFGRLRGMAELLTVPPIRRLAIAVLAVVLITVFFAATPPGRAIAECVIRYIATVLDGGELVVERNDIEPSVTVLNYEGIPCVSIRDGSGAETPFTVVRTFEEFTENTGKKPETLEMPLVELKYVSEPDIGYLVLIATYGLTDGKLVTYQIWDTNCMVSTTDTGYSKDKAGGTVYYSTEENKYVYCAKVMDQSVFTVVSTGSRSAEELVKRLNGN